MGMGDDGPTLTQRVRHYFKSREQRKMRERSSTASGGSCSGSGHSHSFSSFEATASKIFALTFLVGLPAFGVYWEAIGRESYASCSANLASRKQGARDDEERESRARIQPESVPEYLLKARKNARIVRSDGRTITAEIDGTRLVFDKGYSTDLHINDGYVKREYANILVLRFYKNIEAMVPKSGYQALIEKFGEELAISKERPALADHMAKAPQSLPATQAALPGQPDAMAEEEFITEKFIPGKYNEYDKRCMNKPKGEIDFGGCDRIRTSLSVAYGRLHEISCSGSGHQDEEQQKYCAFIRHQMKQPIPKGIAPKRPQRRTIR
jgi:hypothetical protein